MTDPSTPIPDEDLSAHLDGAAGPELAARIAADPAAAARLEALRHAAQVLADTPVAPLAPAAVDQLVSRALGALDDGAPTDARGAAVPVAARFSAAPPTPDGEPPIDGAAPPDTPKPARQGRRLPPTWLVAAAVALVVALGIGLVVTGRDRGGNDQASRSGTEVEAGARTPTPPSSRSSDAATAAPKSDHGMASGAAPSTTQGLAFGPGRVVDLGAFVSPDALRSALAPGFPAASALASPSGVPATAALQRCGTQVAVTLNLKGEPIHVGYATVTGHQVLVYEYPSTSYANKAPTTLVAAVGNQACDPVLTFER
jgi:hypothetical protein